jgi:predicted MFS family arabinose efflux permease
MVPIIFVTEKRRAHAHTLRLAVLGLVLVGVGFALSTGHWWALLACLTAFFVLFNVLEALQPSLVSRIAPTELKGLALGVYNTSPALGLFLGGAVGGWLLQTAGSISVFWALAVISAAWLAVTWKLTVPDTAQTSTPAPTQTVTTPPPSTSL